MKDKVGCLSFKAWCIKGDIHCYQAQVQFIYYEPALPQIPSLNGPWVNWKQWQRTPLKRKESIWAVENTECLKTKIVVGETLSPMASKSTGRRAINSYNHCWLFIIKYTWVIKVCLLFFFISLYQIFLLLYHFTERNSLCPLRVNIVICNCRNKA